MVRTKIEQAAVQKRHSEPDVAKYCEIRRSRMGKIKELQTKLGAPTWIFIYYGVGYAFIFTIATLINMGVIMV